MAGGLFFTCVGVLALVCSCFASVSTYAYSPAPLVAAPAASVVKGEENDPHPQYQFAYNVHDSLTGDIKDQVETRNGGNVAGAYSVIDADGYKRTVSYTADDVNGFNAVVQRDPLVDATPAVAQAAAVVHSAPLTQAPTVVGAAPVLKTFAAPLVRSTPVSRVFAASPVIQAVPVVKSFPFSSVAHSASIAHATPIIRTFAPAPLVRPAPFFRSYAAAPVVQSAPLFSTSYLTSVAAQQSQRLSLQQPLQQFSFFNSSPAIATQEQEQAPGQQQETEVRAEKETQQFAAPQQPENEPIPVEHPEEQQMREQQFEQELKQKQQEEDQQRNQQKQDKQQQQQEQEQEQLQSEFAQQQQVVQEQQKLFAEQQQQFAVQQQEVILQQQQLFKQQQQYYQQQQLPTYPQQPVPQNQLTHPEKYSNNDSEIVDARAVVPEKQNVDTVSHTTAAGPVPANENHKESEGQGVKKSA